MQHHPKQLLAYLKEHKEEFVELVEELVSLETPAGRPDLQEHFIESLEHHFSELDYQTRRLAGTTSGGQLYARPKDRTHGALPQVLVGHCDTRWPTETIQKMPFHHRRGMLQGPGVYDMKTGIAMIIMALKVLRAFDIRPSLTPVVFIYSDEKAGTPESRPTIERLARFAERAFIMEPSHEESGQIFTASKGLGTFHIRIRDLSSDTGFANKPANGSMLKLSQTVQRFHNLADPERDIHVEVGDINNGTRTNLFTGDHYAHVHVRLGNPEDVQFIKQMVFEIESTTSEVDISIDGGIQRPPTRQNERNEVLWNQAQRLADRIDLPVERGIREEATVATLTSPYTATLDGLGPVGMSTHSMGESIDLEETLNRCALLSLLISSP